MTTFNLENSEKILKALKNAEYLIYDEYESLVDDDLKRKYEETIKELSIAIEQLQP